MKHSDVSAWHLQSMPCQPLVMTAHSLAQNSAKLSSSDTFVTDRHGYGFLMVFLKTSKHRRTTQWFQRAVFEFASISNQAEPLALGDFGERGGEIMFCGTSTCRHTLASLRSCNICIIRRPDSLKVTVDRK